MCDLHCFVFCRAECRLKVWRKYPLLLRQKVSRGTNVGMNVAIYNSAGGETTAE